MNRIAKLVGWRAYFAVVKALQARYQTNVRGEQSHSGAQARNIHYKTDTKNTPCYGLIAEDMAKVDSSLVVRDTNGDLLSVRYEQVNAMLLNEFLKEHKKVEAQQSKIEEQHAAISQQDRKIQAQDATIAQLKQGMQVLTTQVKEQAAQIQKVTAQLEVTRPAPKMALNP
jgi:uncharacterized protein (DUF3084 family)